MYMEKETDVLEEVDHYKSDESDRGEEEPHSQKPPCDTRASTSGTSSACTNWVLKISV